MVIEVNEYGFTCWSSEGFIIYDAPFERLKTDHQACMIILKQLHDQLLKDKEK